VKLQFEGMEDPDVQELIGGWKIKYRVEKPK